MSLISFNLPLFLTFTRLILSPFIMPILLVEFLQYKCLEINFALAFLFGVLSLTDFFDGFLARKLRQETELGYLLDPIADKFLLYSTLIALVFVHKIYYYWAVIFIGREFFVMALRQAALSYGFDLGVTKTAKSKTFFQLIYLMFVILNPGNSLKFNGSIFNLVEIMLLLIALYLSVYSAIQYYLYFIKKHQGPL